MPLIVMYLVRCVLSFTAAMSHSRNLAWLFMEILEFPLKVKLRQNMRSLSFLPWYCSILPWKGDMGVFWSESRPAGEEVKVWRPFIEYLKFQSNNCPVEKIFRVNTDISSGKNYEPHNKLERWSSAAPSTVTFTFSTVPFWLLPPPVP